MVPLKTVLYVEYSTGGAFDAPTQNTIMVGIATDHYSFVNPYCSCVLSDDLYPYIQYRLISLRHQQLGLLHHPHVNCTCNAPVTKTGISGS